MVKLVGMVVATLMTGGIGAVAEPLSYNYVYASRIENRVNGEEADGDTVGIFTEINRYWHITVSQGDAGWGPAGAKRTTRRLGIGGQLFLNDKTLLAPSGSLLDIETDTPTRHDRETAWALNLDLRHLIAPGVELLAGIRHLQMKEESFSAGEVGAMYHFNDTVAAGGIARREDGVNATEWTVRLYY